MILKNQITRYDLRCVRYRRIDNQGFLGSDALGRHICGQRYRYISIGYVDNYIIRTVRNSVALPIAGVIPRSPVTASIPNRIRGRSSKVCQDDTRNLIARFPQYDLLSKRLKACLYIPLEIGLQGARDVERGEQIPIECLQELRSVNPAVIIVVLQVQVHVRSDTALDTRPQNDNVYLQARINGGPKPDFGDVRAGAVCIQAIADIETVEHVAGIARFGKLAQSAGVIAESKIQSGPDASAKFNINIWCYGDIPRVAQAQFQGRHVIEEEIDILTQQQPKRLRRMLQYREGHRLLTDALRAVIESGCVPGQLAYRICDFGWIGRGILNIVDGSHVCASQVEAPQQDVLVALDHGDRVDQRNDVGHPLQEVNEAIHVRVPKAPCQLVEIHVLADQIRIDRHSLV